ncbi:poly(A) polymerase [Acidihalobacter yilgarnensis]|uniref:Poly(A) polymerase I n=1 Tax=Acidihalobacter yilgarnensis TaxID=2819280 RepID=A0A1D8IPX8_9GAMM|nr:polynucleotide adenylyltransferase PcnB [Acidihalobacter yilgarnensis]AOU98550.1 poly(A) polymerase [Acidihalobacter yilgarnensis]
MNSPSIPASIPAIIPRAEHIISRARISPNALKVLYRLKDAGYEAYLVGGGVRDLLLGREPKDFDIATNARPEELQSLFRNCRLIGRRFRLAHVRYGREIIEVATFRAPHEIAESDGDAELSEEGRILRDNVYGTFEQDAWRRDFTINALYYDIRDFSVVDHAGGMGDIREGLLRLIGDPQVRYREDPVRMLRAVRFAAKLGFRIEAESEAPLFELAPLLADVAPARLFDEVLKLFQGGAAVQSFELMRHYGLFGVLFPATEAALATEIDGFPLTFLRQALENTDRRVAEGKPVTPAFLFAALLWEPVRQRVRDLNSDELGEIPALQIAAAEISAEQTRRISLPKRFSLPMREIWTQQPRFAQRQGKRPMRLMAHPRFRAAYDFLCLRARVGEIDVELSDWWTRLQESDAEGQQQLLEVAAATARPEAGRRRRRNRRVRKAKPTDA